MNRFKMLARDNNSSPTQYRTWVVPDEPDFTGELYTGLKSGPTPFDNVTTTIILDGYAIADFNLPDPMAWNTTEKVLPEAISDSQLAVIDGYTYLFGGTGSAKIFRAPLNNPADWVDTGATLPTRLGSSHLAIIDTKVYLFGGNDGYGHDGYATDHIFSADLSDPLTWVDEGALLPTKIQNAQLVIIDGYVYLLGGKDEFGGVDIVLQAETDSPLVWLSRGSLLPAKIYNSQIGIIGSFLYLLGGQSDERTPSANIYRCPINNLSSWSLVGILPYPCFNGQFFIIGQRAYLATPTDATVSFTRILRCSFDNPTFWIDTSRTVPGSVNKSQLAIIYDRLFLFGGNGSSVIFADNQALKFDFTAPDATNYSNTTRTQVQATPDKLDLFKVLGFPYWKTNYV